MMCTHSVGQRTIEIAMMCAPPTLPGIDVGGHPINTHQTFISVGVVDVT